MTGNNTNSNIAPNMMANPTDPMAGKTKNEIDISNMVLFLLLTF